MKTREIIWQSKLLFSKIEQIYLGFFFKELDLPLLWPILNFFSAQLKNLGNEWKNIGHIYVYARPI